MKVPVAEGRVKGMDNHEPATVMVPMVPTVAVDPVDECMRNDQLIELICVDEMDWLNRR